MNVGSKSNLFPLNLLYSYLTGYWIDVHGKIWSTRQKAEPQPMKTTYSCNMQHSTLPAPAQCTSSAA